MVAREYGWTHSQILELPDELYHLYTEKAFYILSKQAGMSTYAYDFRTDEKKKLDEWMNSTNDDD